MSYIPDYEVDNGGQGHKYIFNFELSKKVYLCLFGRNKANDARNLVLSENFIYLSPPVTLKIMSRSPLSNQHLSLSQ